jgi:hypothetical protein
LKQSEVLRAAAAVIADNGGQTPGRPRIVGPLERELLHIAERMEGDAPTWPNRPAANGVYDREEVDAANDAAMFLLKAELSLGERDTDLLQLAAAVAAGKIADPEITLDAVIACSYDGITAEAVRSWWNEWA